MNKLRISYDELRNINYFEECRNFKLKSASREHIEEFKKVFCTDNNFKHFVKYYLELKSKVSRNKQLGESCIYCLRDLVYSNEEFCDNDLYVRIIVELVAYLFIEKASFRLGRIEIKNEFITCLDALFDQNISKSASTDTIRGTLGIAESSGVVKVNSLEPNVEYLIASYFMLLLEPILLSQESLTENFKSLVYRQADSFNDLMFKESNRVIIDLKRFSKDSSYSLSNDTLKSLVRSRLNEFINNSVDIFTSNLSLSLAQRGTIENEHPEIILDRRGFLKPEDRFGKLDADIEYFIQEIVSSSGVKVLYSVFTMSFAVLIIEDFSRDDIFLHINYSDIIRDVPMTKENVSIMLTNIYIELRGIYASIINDDMRVSKNITIEDFESKPKSNSLLTSDENYTNKMTFVAPYRRKLPTGHKQGAGKAELARAFNIKLEDDETFVEHFLRKQRVKKSNLKNEDKQSVLFVEDFS